MKKFLLIAMIGTGAAASARAQGTVYFQNALGGVTGVVQTNDNGNTGLAQGVFTVELLYGTLGTPISSLILGAIFTSSTGNGLFYDANPHTLSGIPAGEGTTDTTDNVTVAIQGWTGTYATYAQAVANGALVGVTAEFNNPTGGGGSGPAPPAYLVNWTSANNLVLGRSPEPSTITLGALGAAVLLLFRHRRK